MVFVALKHNLEFPPVYNSGYSNLERRISMAKCVPSATPVCKSHEPSSFREVAPIMVPGQVLTDHLRENKCLQLREQLTFSLMYVNICEDSARCDNRTIRTSWESRSLSLSTSLVSPSDLVTKRITEEKFLLVFLQEDFICQQISKEREKKFVKCMIVS